jgi:hypothetical protein
MAKLNAAGKVNFGTRKKGKYKKSNGPKGKCGITTDYIWESQLPKHEVKCVQCAKLLGFKDLNKKEMLQTPSIRTPTKNR